MERTVVIHANAPDSEGMSIKYTADRHGFDQLRKYAVKMLGFEMNRLFLASGEEVRLVDLLDGVSVWVSSRECYYKFAPELSNKDNHFKVAIFGSGCSGKTTLLWRWLHNVFVDDIDATLEDDYIKQFLVDGHAVDVTAVDASGVHDLVQSRQKRMAEKDGIIFTYGMDKSFHVEELEDYFKLFNSIYGDTPIPLILVATKKDLVDSNPSYLEVSSEEGMTIADRYKATYIETSALTGHNVTELFETVVREMRNKRNPPKAAEEKKESKPPCLIS